MPNSDAMKMFVVDLLKKNLSPFYYYHNDGHTQYVTDKTIAIARQEGCTEKEIELLTAAALWHDTGFVNTYQKHEEESCKLARKYLPQFSYTAADISKVCDIIMATKLPQSPKNKPGSIIADADLEYLGTEQADELAGNLFKELHHLNPALTKAQWNKTQISFLQAHHYFTQYCKTRSEPGKQAYLNRLLTGAIEN